MSERLKLLKATPFISLITDGTQDHAFMEQEIVSVRSAKADRVTVDFITVELVEKTDATGIYNALNTLLTAMERDNTSWACGED